jgi:tight adherence protein B
VGPAAGASPRRPHVEHALVDLVEHTARDVRAGKALRTALLESLDEQPHIVPGLHDALLRGVPLRAALGEISPSPGDMAFVVHGLLLAAETGGAIADTLERVAAVVRERQAWRAERHAQAAQARLSARMLTVLPLVVAGWALVSGPRARQAYVESPATGVLAGMGVALNLIGWMWMRRLVRGPAVA